MQSIRKKLSVLFAVCSIGAILLVILFVNVTVNNKFNQYMMENQNQRYNNIVSYFEEIYKRDGKWTQNSGVELMHEAYMENYCLTLLDSNRKLIWGMDSNDLQTRLHLNKMLAKDKGVYTTKEFPIKLNGKLVGYVQIGQYSPVLLTADDVSFKISINRSIIASGILTLIIIATLSLYFSKQFSRPIKEVAAMSVNLSQGKFDTRSNMESNIEELENLRKSVNILAEKLKYQDRLRQQLVSDISHEVRTPLNVLQNNMEAMVDGIFPVTTERLNYLNEEVIRFGRLINNLEVLKEFESESIKLNFETVALDRLINDICEDFYMIAENKNINLFNNIEANGSFEITGDKDKLKQVFINLIANAVKFSEKGGNVWVSLYSDDKKIIVDIKDNGIGIKEEDLPFIFERLYRGDKSRNQTEGSGIGLTIVKNILQLHFADIDVESKEGEGTTFRIYFNKIIQ